LYFGTLGVRVSVVTGGLHPFLVVVLRDGLLVDLIGLFGDLGVEVVLING